MWQLLWPALFGLFAGLIGTGFQAQLQRREKSEERLERRRELKREKAELVFQEVSNLVKAYNDLYIHALRLLTKGEKPETPPAASNARASALLLVYFPERVPLLDEFDRDMRGIVEKYAKELRDAYKDPDKVRGLHVLIAQESSQRATRLSEQLRPLLEEEIKKLW